jgi:CMP-2-keto-3-deoxyoctulosonic acid synthetase
MSLNSYLFSEKLKKITPLIILPARMSVPRLPGKPLADIHGKHIIWQS